MFLFVRGQSKTVDISPRLRPLVVAALATLSLHLGTAFGRDPNPVPQVPKWDPAMMVAFSRAAAGLDHFFAIWRNPPTGAERFSVKIGLRDAPGEPGYALVQPGEVAHEPVEWFWTSNLRAEGPDFAAEISNDAEALHNVTFGQVIHFTRQYIGDWMYWQDGKIIGNATACPALAHALPEERRQMKEQYGLACD